MPNQQVTDYITIIIKYGQSETWIRVITSSARLTFLVNKEESAIQSDVKQRRTQPILLQFHNNIATTDSKRKKKKNFTLTGVFQRLSFSDLWSVWINGQTTEKKLKFWKYSSVFTVMNVVVIDILTVNYSRMYFCQ